MPFDALNPHSTAVLFFDILNASYHAPRLEPPERKEKSTVIANCVKLRAAADRVGSPVFFAQPNHRDDGRDAEHLYTDTDTDLRPRADPEGERLSHSIGRRPGCWEGEIVEELRPLVQDYVVLKNRWSAFYQTSLELGLRTAGIDTIVLAGGSSKSGITSTAYSARDRDFHLVIVRDAVSASRSSDGGTDADFAWMMDRLFPRLARVRTTDQVTAMLASA